MKRFSSLALFATLFFTVSIGRAAPPTTEQTLQEITALIAESGATKDKSGESGFVSSRFSVTGATLQRLQIREERAVALSATDTPDTSAKEYEFAPGDISKIKTRSRESGFGTIYILDLRAKGEVVKVKETTMQGKTGQYLRGNLILRVSNRDAQKALQKAFSRLGKAIDKG